MTDLFQAKSGSYLICFDASGDRQEKNHSGIVTSSFIKSWWNYLPNVYVVQSDQSPEEFFRSVGKTFEKGRYLISQFSGQFGGRMTFDMWKGLLNADEESLRTLEIKAAKTVERRKEENSK